MMNIPRMIRNDRGAVLVLVAVSMVVLLGIGGLALDSGRGYLTKARLARAVDAAVLAGARSLRLGEDVARQRAIDIAVLNGANGDDIDVIFGVNAEGEQTVRVDAHLVMPTTLMRVLGVETMDVNSAAVAAVPPVDLVLVLDQSYSLAQADAWGDLQDAAKLFIDYFDDGLDQMGLVSFQLRGTERFAMAGAFSATIKNEIDQMQSFGYTNVGEGLRLAQGQITGPAARQRSAKVVVFFTDGRPTAFRGSINGQDRILTMRQDDTHLFNGYYDNPDQLPINRTTGWYNADGCRDFGSCSGWDEPAAIQHAQQLGLDRADEMRGAGVFIYSIGLGNPSSPQWNPDLDYLKMIANEDGVAHSSQPSGRAYFAPSATELRSVFQQVASDLLVRLAQ